MTSNPIRPGVYYNTEAQALPNSDGKRKLRLDIAEVFKHKGKHSVQDRMHHFYVAMDDHYTLSESKVVVAKWRKIAVKVDQTTQDGVTTYRYAVLNLNSLSKRLHLTKQEIAELKRAESKGKANIFIRDKLKSIAKDQQNIKKTLNQVNRSFKQTQKEDLEQTHKNDKLQSFKEKYFKGNSEANEAIESYIKNRTDENKQKVIDQLWWKNRGIEQNLPEKIAIKEGNPPGAFYGAAMSLLGNAGKKMWRYQLFPYDTEKRYAVALASSYVYQTKPEARNDREVAMKIPEGWLLVSVNSLNRLEISPELASYLSRSNKLAKEINDFKTKKIKNRVQKTSILLKNGCEAFRKRLLDGNDTLAGKSILNQLVRNPEFEKIAINFVNHFDPNKPTTGSSKDIMDKLAVDIDHICKQFENHIQKDDKEVRWENCVLLSIFLAAEKTCSSEKLAQIKHWLEVSEPTNHSIKTNLIQQLDAVMNWNRVDIYDLIGKINSQKQNLDSQNLQDDFVLDLMKNHKKELKNLFSSLIDAILKNRLSSHDSYVIKGMDKDFNVLLHEKMKEKKYRKLRDEEISALVYKALIFTVSEDNKLLAQLNVFFDWLNRMKQFEHLRQKNPEVAKYKADILEMHRVMHQLIDE